MLITNGFTCSSYFLSHLQATNLAEAKLKVGPNLLLLAAVSSTLACLSIHNVYGGILNGSVRVSHIRNRKAHLGYVQLCTCPFGMFVFMFQRLFVCCGWAPACQFCIGIVDNGAVCLCVDSKCLFRFLLFYKVGQTGCYCKWQPFVNYAYVLKTVTAFSVC